MPSTEASTARLRTNCLLTPLLLLVLLLGCCPAPTMSAETAFAATIESLALPYALAVMDDGRQVRLDLSEADSTPAPGSRVYVEGVMRSEGVYVRRIAVL